MRVYVANKKASLFKNNMPCTNMFINKQGP